MRASSSRQLLELLFATKSLNPFWSVRRGLVFVVVVRDGDGRVLPAAPLHSITIMRIDFGGHTFCRVSLPGPARKVCSSARRGLALAHKAVWDDIPALCVPRLLARVPRSDRNDCPSQTRWE